MYKQTVIGRLTADALVKDKDAKKIITFSIVSSNTKDDTQFFRCSKFVDQLPGNIESYKKGTLVCVEGKPTINTYVNKENVTVSGFDVSVQTMTVLAKAYQDNQESVEETPGVETNSESNNESNG